MTLTATEQTRALSFVFSDDVASLVMCVVARGAATFGRAYNAACVESCTLARYCELIARELGVADRLAFAIVDDSDQQVVDTQQIFM